MIDYFNLIYIPTISDPALHRVQGGQVTLKWLHEIFEKNIVVVSNGYSRVIGSLKAEYIVLRHFPLPNSNQNHYDLLVTENYDGLFTLYQLKRYFNYPKPGDETIHLVAEIILP